MYMTVSKQERKRIMDMYGDDKPITSYLISTGSKISTTTQKKLDRGIVDELDDDQDCNSIPYDY